MYIRTQAPGLLARVLQAGMPLLGMKGRIGRIVRTGKGRKIAARLSARLKRLCTVTVQQHAGRKVWTLVPKEGATQKTILYLHGGAYVANLLSFHWDLVAELVARTGATVVVPDYPLAPDADCPAVYDFLEALYADVQAAHPTKELVLMGDSAGGGLALGLAQQLRAGGGQQPEHIILLCPWLDVAMDHADLPALDALDPMLDIQGLIQAGRAYAGLLPTNDPRVSPIHGDLQGLAPIAVFTATRDMLLVDARRLKERLEQIGTGFHYYEYPGLFHVWMAVTQLPEAQEALDQVAALVGRVAQR